VTPDSGTQFRAELNKWNLEAIQGNLLDFGTFGWSRLSAFERD